MVCAGSLVKGGGSFRNSQKERGHALWEADTSKLQQDRDGGLD